MLGSLYSDKPLGSNKAKTLNKKVHFAEDVLTNEGPARLKASEDTSGKQKSSTKPFFSPRPSPEEIEKVMKENLQPKSSKPSLPLKVKADESQARQEMKLENKSTKVVGQKKASKQTKGKTSLIAKSPAAFNSALDNTTEAVLSDESIDRDDQGNNYPPPSPWFLESELTKDSVVPSSFDGLRVVEIIGSRNVTLGSKMQVGFVTGTVVVMIILSWMEILDVYDSECKGKNFEHINLMVRFGIYLVSRFYLASVINIELLSNKPYNAQAWKGLWPTAFQATSFMIIADIFTFDYVECLSFHEVFTQSTAFVFSFIALAFTILSAVISSVKLLFSDEVEVDATFAKTINFVILVALALMLMFGNMVFIILTYAQIGNSAPLLYIEFIMYYVMLLIWIGKLARSLYKKRCSKKIVRLEEMGNASSPVIVSEESGKKVISLEVIRMNTERKSLK